MFRSTIALACSLLLLWITVGGCPSPRGPDFGLPSLTSKNPQAEAEMAEARALHSAGDIKQAEQRYRRFLIERSDDALVPVAQLSLGRILLERGEVEQAARFFEAVARHRDPSVAEQGRFYGAVADHRRGRHAEALTVLRPMVGRTIDPADTALLLRTLGEAFTAESDYYNAVKVIDEVSGEALPEEDRRWAAGQIERLVEQQASSEDIERLYRELPKEGLAWPLVVKRAVRDADAAGDSERARELLEVMRERGMPIEAEFEAIAIRAERPEEADPKMVGAVLSLSGRARKVGEQALRGLMLAAGLPPRGPQPEHAPRIVFRDDGGDPARAVEAVNELASVHRVIAIIGPIDADAAEAAAARAQELGVPLIALSPAGQVTADRDLIYRLFPTPRAEVQRLLSHAKASGQRRLAALLPEGAYGDVMQQTLEQESPTLGLSLVATVRYPADATSFGPQVAELARERFDTLFLADSAKRAALIAPALAAAGLWPTPRGERPAQGGRPIMLLAPSVAFDHGLARSVGRYLQGAVFSVPFDALTASGSSQGFTEDFNSQFGESPDMFAAFAHDAYRMVRSVVDAGVVTRENLGTMLRNARPDDLAGPSPGFSPDREAARATRLIELRGESFVPVE